MALYISKYVSGIKPWDLHIFSAFERRLMSNNAGRCVGNGFIDIDHWAPVIDERINKLMSNKSV